MNAADPKTIKEYSTTGRHQECLQACQQLHQREPGNPFSWKYAGKSFLALGQFEKAQQCLAKAHQLDTSDPEIANDIGNSFLNLGNKDAASQWYEKSLSVNNNYAPAINNVAHLKMQSGNNQWAVNLFKQAIQADPQLVQAYLGAAASSLALGDLDQAESFATQAIEINAQTPGINEILGIVFQNKKNFKQAVESYQKELAINPQSNTSLLNLGLLLLQQGEAAAAIEPLTRAAAINTSEQCSLLLAQAYQSVGQLKEAIIAYKNIDMNKCQNKLVPYNLGICLSRTKNNIDAIDAFKVALQIDDKFTEAWIKISVSLKIEGHTDEALNTLQRALSMDPENALIHSFLGEIHKDLGNLDKALHCIMKSIELKPDNPNSHLLLAKIYKCLGNSFDAKTETAKYLKLISSASKSEANIEFITDLLGEKLVSQNFVPTFFDNGIVQSLSQKVQNSDVDYAKIYQELHISKVNRFMTYTERVARTKNKQHLDEFRLSISQGTHSPIKWKEYDIYKSSNDLVVYWMIFQEVKPEVIIELGSGVGGSAIWMADICQSLGLDTKIISLDIEMPRATHPNVTFQEFDLMSIGCMNIGILESDKLNGKKKIIIEDAHVNLLNVLIELDKALEANDYLIIEDSRNKQEQISVFMDKSINNYAIDQYYLDFFGINTTCCIDSIFKVT